MTFLFTHLFLFIVGLWTLQDRDGILPVCVVCLTHTTTHLPLPLTYPFLHPKSPVSASLSLTYSLTLSLSQSLPHCLTLAHSFTHSLTHSLCHSLTLSLTHSLTHSHTQFIFVVVVSAVTDMVQLGMYFGIGQDEYGKGDSEFVVEKV